MRAAIYYYFTNEQRLNKEQQRVSFLAKPFLMLCLFIASLGSHKALAQLKVGDNPTTINASSLLELESTDKGVLLPRLELTSTNSASPLGAHVAGMVIYNTATAGSGATAVTPGFYYNNGSQWVNVSAASGTEWNLSTGGDAYSDKTSQIARTGSVVIGTGEASGQYSLAVGNGASASGSNSRAMGPNTTASGTNSTAMGMNTTASGNYASFAIGNGSTASYNNTTAMGYQTTASGDQSTSMGGLTTASGNNSTAMGRQTTASGNYSTAMGNNTTASGQYSTAMGNQSLAGGQNSFAAGEKDTTTGQRAIAMGYKCKSTGTGAVAIGTNSWARNSSSLNSYAIGTNNYSDRAFVFGSGDTGKISSIIFGRNNFSEGYGTCIGWSCYAGGAQELAVGYQCYSKGYPSVSVGVSDTATGQSSTAIGIGSKASGNYSTALGYKSTANHSNSFAVGVGATTTAGGQFAAQFTGGYNFISNSTGTSGVQLAGGSSTWSSISDRRAKNSIKGLHYGLNEVLKIKPSRYYYKGSDKLSLGFIAQEMKEVIPEIVETPENPDEMMSIRYTELIPVLAKAIQEQQELIEKQQELLQGQQGLLDALKAENDSQQAQIDHFSTVGCAHCSK